MDVEELARLYRDERLSAGAVGARYGVSDYIVRRQLRAAGVELRPRGFAKHTLVERVRSGSFRADRHTPLLDEQILPPSIAHELRTLQPLVLGRDRRARAPSVRCLFRQGGKRESGPQLSAAQLRPSVVVARDVLLRA
jgi:hypothetical protein